jgi:hypothetical protein
LCRHRWAIQMFRHHHNCHHNNNRPVSSPPWIFTVLQLEHRQQAKQLPWRIASSDHRLWLLLVEVAWTEWFLFTPVGLTKKRWGRVADSWATQSQSTTFPLSKSSNMYQNENFEKKKKNFKNLRRSECTISMRCHVAASESVSCATSPHSMWKNNHRQTLLVAFLLDQWLTYRCIYL